MLLPIGCSTRAVYSRTLLTDVVLRQFLGNVQHKAVGTRWNQWPQTPVASTMLQREFCCMSRHSRLFQLQLVVTVPVGGNMPNVDLD